MAKKKKTQKNNKAKTILFFISMVFVILCVASLGYLIIKNENKTQNLTQNLIQNKTQNKVQKEVKIPTHFEETKEKSKNLNQSFSDIFSQNKDYESDDECKVQAPTCLNDDEEKKEKSVFSNTNKVKLAIIIDDVASKKESDAIKNIINNGKILNPSFFPSDKNHPHTKDYAKEFKEYLIHLPLEAIKFNSPELLTLKTSNTYETIEKRIKNIKKDFSNLLFINNHTGSKFTSDLAAMQKLFKALKKYNLIFLDSRTSVNTKAPALVKDNNQFYIHRDVFLDNSLKYDDIKKQLDLAVQTALKKGFAIAIAHPHDISLKVISEYDFSKVRLVYISDIYNDYR
ncbi:divergent polysaccharide deacetylase family protein [Campylobacter canadensis]|uniref:divergent polysaccharide deacetylase family protein n=1 Tax=Campylobacter canadensis TaxID=449520 RepID=UPI001CCB5EE9|nr:divergent polysaccharide deacetylase family protein [Campylobacter canadensis]MBZ7996830.1 divergent polysaccharide deacetylase family protein [Campylobacter canadensis]MBZ7999941.1 divergent polysaccharide deacetylase family protein [Campylobacter canadensis]MBZ8002574.1 divergent polysaccharide deacetylase family protein [Campylobacter canadensis]MBZ8004502.1 divergent polysaccharide deacetylase family protein [Campylobacter canadensis]